MFFNIKNTCIIFSFFLTIQLYVYGSEKNNKKIILPEIEKVSAVEDPTHSPAIQIRSLGHKVFEELINATGVNQISSRALNYTGNPNPIIDPKSLEEIKGYFSDSNKRDFGTCNTISLPIESTPSKGYTYTRKTKGYTSCNNTTIVRKRTFEDGLTLINPNLFNNLSASQQRRILKKENKILNKYYLPYVEVGCASVTSMVLFHAMKKGYHSPFIKKFVEHNTQNNKFLSLGTALLITTFVGSKILGKKSAERIVKIADQAIEHNIESEEISS